MVDRAGEQQVEGEEGCAEDPDEEKAQRDRCEKVDPSRQRTGIEPAVEPAAQALAPVRAESRKVTLAGIRIKSGMSLIN